MTVLIKEGESPLTGIKCGFCQADLPPSRGPLPRKYCDNNKLCEHRLKYAYEQNRVRTRVGGNNCWTCGMALPVNRPRSKWFCSRKCAQRAWYLREKDMQLVTTFARSWLAAMEENWENFPAPPKMPIIKVNMDHLQEAVERLERVYL